MHVALFILVFVTFNHPLHGRQLHQSEPSLVYPAFLDGRGLSGSRILKINEDITLNLKKSSVLADKFLVRSYVGDILRHTYLRGSYFEENLFHDETAMASVTISEDDGLQVNGMIGDKLRIVPALEQERSSDGRVAHMLHEIVETYEGLHKDYVVSERGSLNITQRALNPARYHVQQIVTEMFILVDTVFFEEFGCDLTAMLLYICRTFNAMNLRYLGVTSPKVQHRLMGVEVLTSEKESFLEIIPNRVNGIDGLKSVYNLKDFVQRNRNDYELYDMVYLITGRDMMVQIGSHIDNGNMGFAFVGAVCGDRKVGMGEDKAETFMGVRVMSHEVGHLMGCPHDGDPGPPELGGYGSQHCPFSEGYLMSYITENSNQYRFSSCCDYLMSLMAWSTLGDCLHEENAQCTLNVMYEESLPGKAADRNRQCQLGYPQYKETYFMKEKGIRNCEMQCFVPRYAYGYDTHLPLALTDGTICNEHKYVCINGVCRRNQTRYES